MNSRSILVASLLLILVLVPGTARAQEETPDGPVYIVQPGDTLSSVALRFGVRLDDLIQTNGITNPNQLAEGDRLTIPGLSGVRGVLVTETLPFGETLRSLARRRQVPYDQILRLNRVVNPASLYVGAPVVLPEAEEAAALSGRTLLSNGQSLLELSAGSGLNPWSLRLINGLEGGMEVLPGDVLFTPDGERSGPGALPPAVLGVEVRPLPLVQGETAEVRVNTAGDLTLDGDLATIDLRSGDPRVHALRFFAPRQGEAVALQGIHAMTEVGLYPLQIRIQLPGGQTFRHTQMVPVVGGGYHYDPPLSVPAVTLDPEETGPEDEIWYTLGVEATPEKMWSGRFESPSPFGDCWTSLFGSRRSYNGSPYNYFHTGLDFCGGVGIEITAPAPGVVVFAEPLVVRGKSTVIDHGWGVYTAYMHQSELLVEAGDSVDTGDVIGLVGGTGRVTGAHLHWEVWVGNVQVQPLQWLEQGFPLESP